MPTVPKPTYKKREKKRISRVSKKDRVRWKNKAITLAKKIVRETVKVCERCGKIGKMDGAHIIPVDIEPTAADLDNILCLCAHCHTLGRLSCHSSPLHFAEWLESYAPGRKKLLLERAALLSNYCTQDWIDKYEALNLKAHELGITP